MSCVASSFAGPDDFCRAAGAGYDTDTEPRILLQASGAAASHHARLILADSPWKSPACRALCRSNGGCLGFNLRDAATVCELLFSRETEPNLDLLGDAGAAAAAARIGGCRSTSSLAACARTRTWPFRAASAESSRDVGEMQLLDGHPLDNGKACEADLLEHLSEEHCGPEDLHLRAGALARGPAPGRPAALAADPANVSAVVEVLAEDEPLAAFCAKTCCARTGCRRVDVLRGGAACRLWVSGAAENAALALVPATSCASRVSARDPRAEVDDFVYSGAPRCMTRSATSPITIALEGPPLADEDATATCRSRCAAQPLLCRAFTVHFGSPGGCTLYTSVGNLFAHDASQAAAVFARAEEAGSAGAVDSLPWTSDNATWGLSNAGVYAGDITLDASLVVGSHASSTDVAQTACWVRRDALSSDREVLTDYLAAAEPAQDFEALSSRCDSLRSYVLRHGTGWRKREGLGDQARGLAARTRRLSELCAGACSSANYMCRGFAADPDAGDCYLYVNWDRVTLEDSPFAGSIMIGGHRFERTCVFASATGQSGDVWDLVLTRSQLRGFYGDDVAQRVEEQFPDSVVNDDSERRALGMTNDYSNSLWRYTRYEGPQRITIVPVEVPLGGSDGFTDAQAAFIWAELDVLSERLRGYIEFRTQSDAATVLGLDEPLDGIRFFDGEGCWSWVGHRGGSQDISLQSNGCLSRRHVHHETLHALGFMHEMNRPDRDQYIDIHTENLQAGMESNFELLTEYIDSMGSPYDLKSVMHYSRFAFAADPSLPTITAKEDAEMELGSDELSDEDVTQVMMLGGASAGDYLVLMGALLPFAAICYCGSRCTCSGADPEDSATVYAEVSHPVEEK
ncbi:Zinc metalloproteinase nas-14 [Hondaea fermentalgiana]|uniref:Metalloendopeptidase n=1 Tax=Hondaea fermentalgiana TaxID=2315210 RepID=A0A2R5GCB5_9STRA|nr:Zinc metalloproteinase nas-14 [Hondaea fermentalgiana]|eukprot:GBG28620.1 Zinc metalloproteinase nas-14 [Hondaea fermentalgiana]